MITDPARYLEPFRDAGADGCTVHVEVGETAALCAQMRDLGLRVGLAANPDTPFEALEPYLHLVDLVLCMTVFPGFGGQSFIADVLPKVAQVRPRRRRRRPDPRHRGRRRDRRAHGGRGRPGRGQRLRGRLGRLQPGRSARPRSGRSCRPPPASGPECAS